MVAEQQPWLSPQGYLLLACVAFAVAVLLPRCTKGGAGSGVLLCMPRLSCSRGARAACCDALGDYLNRRTRHCEQPPNEDKAREDDVEMTVIWLHSLGHDNAFADATCPSWSPLQRWPFGCERVETTLHSLLPRARFVSPSADASPITAEDLTPLIGCPLRSWFDIYGKTPLSAYDESGIELAVERVNQLIEGEIARGTPASRIVLAGASQGGALALTTALCCGRHKIAGVLTYASYIPLTRIVHHSNGVGLVPPPLSGVNTDTRLLIMHGTDDSLISPVYSELIVGTLRLLGMDVDMYGLDGWDHAEHPFKSKAKKPSAADKLQAERAGISSDDDVGDAAHYAASWLNETVRRSVASAADAEDGKSGEPLGPGWRHGVGAELTAGLLVEGRPSVDRLHDEAVQATLPVFTLSGQRCGVLGGLSDVKWQLPLPQMRHDLDPTGSSRAAITTNLFTAIALHDIPTVEFILNVEKFPIAGLRSHRGRSPLHAAVLAESPLVTGLLITHGVDPNVKDEDGHTPLTLCLLPDEELAALGDAPPPRLLEKRRRATFALPLVVLGGAKMSEQDWTLAETHYNFLVPHIRHFQGLDAEGQKELKEMMDLKQVGEWKNQEKKKGKSERRTWPGGHRTRGMTRSAREVNIFYGLFGGGVLFGCAVAEGYRHRWDELPFHPRVMLFNVLACVALHLWLRLSDPGYVPLPEGSATPGGDHPAAPKEEDVAAAALAQGRTYCSLCRVSQPPRTYHCKDCGRCVTLRDHHCVWLDNCIGERNSGAFVAFLVLFNCTGWMAVIDVSKAFMVGTVEIQEKSGMVIFYVLWAFLLMGIAASCMFSNVFLATLYYWSRGYTQNELVRNDQAMEVLYLRPPKSRSNPHDTGRCVGNICSIARPAAAGAP